MGNIPSAYYPGDQNRVLVKCLGASRKCGGGGSTPFWLIYSPGVRGRKCACERHLVKANNLRNFQGRQKVRSGSQRTPPPASFKHTSSIFLLLDPGMHPHSLAPSCPHSHLPFPTPSGSALSLMQRWQQASPPTPAPSVEGAPDRSEGRTVPAGRLIASPSHPTACGARLLQLS